MRNYKVLTLAVFTGLSVGLISAQAGSCGSSNCSPNTPVALKEMPCAEGTTAPDPLVEALHKAEAKMAAPTDTKKRDADIKATRKAVKEEVEAQKALAREEAKKKKARENPIKPLNTTTVTEKKSDPLMDALHKNEKAEQKKAAEAATFEKNQKNLQKVADDTQKKLDADRKVKEDSIAAKEKAILEKKVQAKPSVDRKARKEARKAEKQNQKLEKALHAKVNEEAAKADKAKAAEVAKQEQARSERNAAALKEKKAAEKAVAAEKKATVKEAKKAEEPKKVESAKKAEPSKKVEAAKKSEKKVEASKSAKGSKPGTTVQTKEEKLAELLRRYRADEITPHQYHQERAKILAEP